MLGDMAGYIAPLLVIAAYCYIGFLVVRAFGRVMHRSNCSWLLPLLAASVLAALFTPTLLVGWSEGGGVAIPAPVWAEFLVFFYDPNSTGPFLYFCAFPFLAMFTFLAWWFGPKPKLSTGVTNIA